MNDIAATRLVLEVDGSLALAAALRRAAARSSRPAPSAAPTAAGRADP